MDHTASDNSDVYYVDHTASANSDVYYVDHTDSILMKMT